MRVLIIISIAFSILSCKKDPLRKMTGEYSCDATNNSWILGEPSTVTTYSDTVLVTEEGKHIYIEGGWQYPRDSIRAGETYSIVFGTYALGTFTFSQDSLVYTTWSGGLGGGSTTNRTCVKF